MLIVMLIVNSSYFNYLFLRWKKKMKKSILSANIYSQFQASCLEIGFIFKCALSSPNGKYKTTEVYLRHNVSSFCGAL